jgi:hypothetical protein
MTEGDPEPTDPEPTGADHTAPEPANSKPRRSTEFWVAIVSVCATVIVGVTGTWFAYRGTIAQVHAEADRVTAESDRTALQFNKEQRITAYANYLASLTNLGNDEFLLTQDFIKFPKVDIKLISADFNRYEDDFKRNNIFSATVGLVRSRGVVAPHGALATKHNDLHNRMIALLVAADASDIPTVQTKANELGHNLDLSRDLDKNFVEAAKRDLGMSN